MMLNDASKDKLVVFKCFSFPLRLLRDHRLNFFSWNFFVVNSAALSKLHSIFGFQPIVSWHNDRRPGKIMAALNENQGKNNNPSWRNVMYGLKPFVGFAICLASAFFKTGTKVAVKHLNSVSPVLISCIQYLVIGLLAQPIAACRSNIESPFPKGMCELHFIIPI